MFFESLESRQHLSANLSGQEPGLLIIFGRTPGNDVISITRQSNGRIRVDDNGTVKTFAAAVRIDTPVELDYYRNGGILQTVLRKLLS